MASGTDTERRFWLARSSKAKASQPVVDNGRFWFKYENAQDLYDAANEYFQWVESNPLEQDNVFAYQGNITHEPVAKMRAMTIAGLCVFLGISSDCFKNYRQGRPDPVMADVCKYIEDVIRTQKFEGAAAGMLSATVICRDIGLSDKTELVGPGGGPLQMVRSDMTLKEAAEAYAATLNDSKG